MKNKGLFITFEGGEGAGKSTQIKNLTDYLTQKGYDVVLTREPGGTVGAEAVRELLLSGKAEKMGSLAEAILFAAARADNVEQIIEPALKQGKVVLCDRFIDSTRVYQGSSVSPQQLHLLEEAAINNVKPNVTFILDIAAKLGMERANKRRAISEKIDRFEKDNLDIQEKRRQAFLKIAHQEPQRCKVIDATQSIDKISNDIKQIIDSYL